MNMYFVALVAPEEIDQQVVKWKNFFKERYQCTVALKSPAHITLIPPFWMTADLENELIGSIGRFNKTKNSFPITLKDFSSFKPKVIYVDIIENESLLDLRYSLNEFIFSQNKYPVQIEDGPFQPHITLATRDLYKKAFFEAWQVFSQKQYQALWKVTGISLLRHNKKNWDVIFTSQLED